MVDVFVKERKEEVFLIRYRGAIVETSGSIISEAKVQFENRLLGPTIVSAVLK
jgi:hypothetical protein